MCIHIMFVILLCKLSEKRRRMISLVGWHFYFSPYTSFQHYNIRANTDKKVLHTKLIGSDSENKMLQLKLSYFYFIYYLNTYILHIFIKTQYTMSYYYIQVRKFVKEVVITCSCRTWEYCSFLNSHWSKYVSSLFDFDIFFALFRAAQ